MGPDWLKLITAAPWVVVYAIGEIALVVAPLFAILAVLAYVAPLRNPRRKLMSAAVLGTIAAIAAIPAAIYWVKGRDNPPDPAASYRPAPSLKRAKVGPLDPPNGKPWPRATGYLEMPQAPQGGTGVIKVAGGSHRVYAKLCEAGRQPCPGLRHALVLAGTDFTFRDLPPGTYEVRYLPIDRPTVGGRSQPVRITETYAPDPVVKVDDSPVLDSSYAVVGILPKDF